jgi:hypothetical protein
MEMSPDTWMAILIVAGVVGGGIMFWGTSPRKKK